MTQFDALGVRNFGNSSTSKDSASGAFHKEQQEERVVSLRSLGESSQLCDPSKRRNLRTSSRVNVFGSR
jgi:hypothetical protein